MINSNSVNGGDIVGFNLPSSIADRRLTSLLTTGQLVQGADGDIYVVLLPQQQQQQQHLDAPTSLQLPHTAPPLPSPTLPLPLEAVQYAKRIKRSPSGSSRSSLPATATASTAASTSYLAETSTKSGSLKSVRSKSSTASAKASTPYSAAAASAAAVAADRRLSHNEVERRRRDKINALIGQLAELMPGVGPEDADSAASASGCNRTGSKPSAASAAASGPSSSSWCSLPKSAVLDRAVAYFDRVRLEEIRLVRERDNLRTRLAELESKSDDLLAENTRLRLQLRLESVEAEANVKVFECEDTADAATLQVNVEESV